MRFMSGLSAIKKAFSDKPGIIRPLVVAVLILTWYMTFFACVLSDGKYFYVSNLLMWFVFLKSEALWSVMMLVILCVFLAASFSDKLLNYLVIGFLVETAFSMLSSWVGFGIHWNANGSTTINDFYIADILTSLASTKPFSFLYGFLVSEDKYVTGGYGYDVFGIIPAVACLIGAISIAWRGYLKKKGDRK